MRIATTGMAGAALVVVCAALWSAGCAAEAVLMDKGNAGTSGEGGSDGVNTARAGTETSGGSSHVDDEATGGASGGSSPVAQAGSAGQTESAAGAPSDTEHAAHDGLKARHRFGAPWASASLRR